MISRILLCVILLFALVILTEAQAEEGLKPMPLSSYESYPSWSPDGNYIIFTSDYLGNQDIWRISLEKGSKLEQLTSAAGKETYPAYSPTGQSIAYVSDKQGNDDIWILSFNQEGTRSLKQITQDPAIDTQPAWSPDGTKIAFASNRGGDTYDIFVISFDGGIKLYRLTTTNSINESYPTWSPDGRYIAYQSDNKGNSDIWVREVIIDAEDGISFSDKATQFTTSEYEEGEPSWSPNGQFIAYTSNSSNDNYKIYIKPVKGGDAKRLTSPALAGWEYAPSWHPNGKTLAVFSDRDVGQNGDIFIFNR